jgi:ceramide glucosyltransferase
LLKTVAAEFQDSRLGLTTCPYRAVAGRSFWSMLEAIGMNTEFLAGVLVARMTEGMKFAVGPTIVARKKVLEAIGGWDRLKDYLAEDFVMGAFAAEKGYGVGLSSFVIEHRIGTQGFRANLSHRIRWSRSTRRSRPWGYFGQIFTTPFPIVLVLLVFFPEWWPAAVVSLALRALAAWATAGWVLHDPLCARRWWLVPVQDLTSFACWMAGFFGNTIRWRGRKYYLYRDGCFRKISD